MNNLSERTLSLQRVLNAPIELVWDAWTQAEHIVQWWGPKGMTVQVVEHNFSPGGHWEYRMLMPNGGEFISKGVYTEIVVMEKIISSASFIPMTEGVEIQALFEAKAGQTLFTFKVVHPSVAYCQQQEKMGFYNGWGSTFERLQEYLQQGII